MKRKKNHEPSGAAVLYSYRHITSGQTFVTSNVHIRTHYCSAKKKGDMVPCKSPDVMHSEQCRGGLTSQLGQMKPITCRGCLIVWQCTDTYIGREHFSASKTSATGGERGHARHVASDRKILFLLAGSIYLQIRVPSLVRKWPIQSLCCGTLSFFLAVTYVSSGYTKSSRHLKVP